MTNPESFAASVRAADVYPVVNRTPLQHAANVSEELERDIFIKREDMQPVFSFKCRGAFHRVSELVRQGVNGGVAAASAGNHGQGVAISARHHGLRAVIVMPRTAPDVKVAAVRRLGAEVVLHGDSYEEAAAHLGNVVRDEGLVAIHPFDEMDVIVGQATVARELLEQMSDQIPDVVFIPCGGGGLLSGCAAYIKAVAPSVQIIGVEPEDSACAKAALEAGERVTLTEVGLFADGVAVKTVGEYAFPLIQRYCDEIITVSVDEICGGVRDLFEDFRVLAEPAGALAMAGIRRWCDEDRPGQVLAGILSGANTNFERVGHIVERASVATSREALLCVQIPEQPGSFLNLCEDMGHCKITEFNYRYSNETRAEIFIGIGQPTSYDGRRSPGQRLRDKGYELWDLTENELAKGHLRYMVGGHNPRPGNERVYSFIFPERPGSLLEFLRALGSRWNITLFHYRNHGSAYGRIFAGFDLGSKSGEELEADLKRINYRFRAETENRAYRLFLR